MVGKKFGKWIVIAETRQDGRRGIYPRSLFCEPCLKKVDSI